MPIESVAHTRAVVYCIVPERLAGKLHEPLRRHFADDPSVEVVVEQRWRNRRAGAASRRSGRSGPPPGQPERRRIRGEAGRRVADRRAPVLSTTPPRPLPRSVQRHADALVFIERLRASAEELEDRDTAHLVTRIQAGEAEVFGELYLRYFDRVYAYLKAVLADAHAAEDATQHVFTKVLAALPRYERRAQPFRAWLFRIVRNSAIDRLNERHREPLIEPSAVNGQIHDEDACAEVPLDSLQWVSDPELIMLIERLPMSQRQVLLLRFMLDLSYREIGVILGRRENDVRALQYRALQFLRQRLDAVGRTSARGRRVPMHRVRSKSNLLRARRFALLG